MQQQNENQKNKLIKQVYSPLYLYFQGTYWIINKPRCLYYRINQFQQKKQFKDNTDFLDTKKEKQNILILFQNERKQTLEISFKGQNLILQVQVKIEDFSNQKIKQNARFVFNLQQEKYLRFNYMSSSEMKRFIQQRSFEIIFDYEESQQLIIAYIKKQKAQKNKEQTQKNKEQTQKNKQQAQKNKEQGQKNKEQTQENKNQKQILFQFLVLNQCNSQQTLDYVTENIVKIGRFIFNKDVFQSNSNWKKILKNINRRISLYKQKICLNQNILNLIQGQKQFAINIAQDKTVIEILSTSIIIRQVPNLTFRDLSIFMPKLQYIKELKIDSNRLQILQFLPLNNLEYLSITSFYLNCDILRSLKKIFARNGKYDKIYLNISSVYRTKKMYDIQSLPLMDLKSICLLFNYQFEETVSNYQLIKFQQLISEIIHHQKMSKIKRILIKQDQKLKNVSKNKNCNKCLFKEDCSQNQEEYIRKFQF